MQDVRRLILETRHTALPTDRAAALLMDADLSVFGADDMAFRAYERAIRREYGWASWTDYRAGRRQVLESFLAREAVYTTPEFAGLETGARRHLEAAGEVLSGAGSEENALAAWTTLGGTAINRNVPS